MKASIIAAAVFLSSSLATASTVFQTNLEGKSTFSDSVLSRSQTLTIDIDKVGAKRVEITCSSSPLPEVKVVVKANYKSPRTIVTPPHFVFAGPSKGCEQEIRDIEASLGQGKPLTLLVSVSDDLNPSSPVELRLIKNP